jgi:hypothetical protein
MVLSSPVLDRQLSQAGPSSGPLPQGQLEKDPDGQTELDRGLRENHRVPGGCR